ncbi:MAG: helix-turn-helix transcriptional regulator [Acidimicrobiales bacterium]
MRADRLMSVLLLLQARGRVTAAEVAAELEVSERTARRDLEALSMAGVPVYSQQGRNGGWQLIGGARTDLSGLTADEARALFLVAGPSSQATPQVKQALRKLVQALPEPFRPGAEAATTAVVVDPTEWGGRRQQRPSPPHLDAIQRAVVEGEQVRLSYVSRDRESTERVIHPLGLAAKGHVWYLVADTDAGQRTFRVDRVTAVEPTGLAVVRPPDFDLTEAWGRITAEVDERRSPFRGRGTVEAGSVGLLRQMFGEAVRIGGTTGSGRVEFELAGWNVWSVAGELAGLGRLVEMTEPAELLDRLGNIGRELSTLYGPDLRGRVPVDAERREPGRARRDRVPDVEHDV